MAVGLDHGLGAAARGGAPINVSADRSSDKDFSSADQLKEFGSLASCLQRLLSVCHFMPTPDMGSRIRPTGSWQPTLQLALELCTSSPSSFES